MRVLVVNAGSSSLKLRVLDEHDELVLGGDLDPLTDDAACTALESWLREAPPVDAVGHRIVHGGHRYWQHVVLTAEVLGDLAHLSDLAPLHNPPALEAVDIVGRIVPDLPAVACFDTVFHADLPDPARTYAVPWAWTSELGVRRYGFHGLSHAWASRRAGELLGAAAGDLRLVTCHLGSGASLAAIAGGHSVDTTMGFTPLDGLVMSTRSGAVDPGALLWVQQQAGLSLDETLDALEHDSGLLGVSGVSGDVRRVFDAADEGHRRSQLALGVFLHRLRAGIAAMTAALGGLDAVVFTGGVGENSPRIRAATCDGLAFLGIALDHAANEGASGDSDVSAHGAMVRSLVVTAREDLEIAGHVRRLLTDHADRG